MVILLLSFNYYQLVLICKYLVDEGGKVMILNFDVKRISTYYFFHETVDFYNFFFLLIVLNFV